jgi:hypothetical protein
MDYNQSQDEVTRIIGIMSVEDKPTLVGLLQSSGSLVTELSTQDEILDATFKAIRDSNKFRNDLKKYFTQTASELSDSDYGNYVDSDFFNLTPSGKTRAGNALSSIFSQENISKLGSLGIDALGSKLNNAANKGAGKQAIDYERAKSDSAAAQALADAAATERLKAQKDLGTKDSSKSLPKWVLPVSIGGGLLVIGTIVFFAMRKKSV